MNLKLNFSPCPNDTFMFDAMVNGRIPTEEFSFHIELLDIQELNKRVFENDPDISKISFFAFASVMDKYDLLTAGAAMGNGVGPLLISKKKFENVSDIESVAIPGKNTTAYFLFRTFYPQLINTKEIIFSDIENALLKDEVDAGVIIHENRFTYSEKGLLKIADLGELWEKETNSPIPLGGIVIKKSLSQEIKQKVNSLLSRSVQFAFDHPEASFEYVREHAQEMSPEVRKKHIELYVNDYSVDLKEKGENAIKYFIERAARLNPDTNPEDLTFIR